MDQGQGIVHVMGPEQGATLPGMTVVCGDSHTSTHGAFGALAHGIGTSEVEHTMATQCITAKKSKSMLIEVQGSLKANITAKDVALYIIGQIGTAGGTGYAIEFGGEAIRSLTMEGRMTLCNMAIEAGARSGMVAVDQTTIDYVQGKPFAPKGEAWDKAVEYWRTLVSDEGAKFDKVYTFRAEDIEPQVTWGTSPEMVLDISGKVPNPADEADPVKRSGMERALEYMGLQAGMAALRNPRRYCVYRLVHQQPHRRFARSRRRGQRPQKSRQRLARVDCARLGLGKTSGRRRGLGQNLHRRGLRVARTGLLDVSGDERRPAHPRPALRLHFQPQF